MKRRLTLLISVLLLSVAVGSAQFKYSTLECPGINLQWIGGINNDGVMVGAFITDTDPNWHAVMIRNGKCIPLAPQTVLGSSFSGAWSVNESTNVVGMWQDSAAGHGYLLDKKGLLTPIEFPTADGTAARGINQSGIIVGEWDILDSLGSILSSHGFIWKDGAFTDVMLPGVGFTTITGINARGEFVGFAGPDYNLPTNKQGFVFANGQYTRFDVPFDGAVGTIAEGINDKGQIIGAYFYSDGFYHSFLKTGTQFVPVEYPRSVMTNLLGVNNKGQMVGWYFDSNFALHALLVEPAK